MTGLVLTEARCAGRGLGVGVQYPAHGVGVGVGVGARIARNISRRCLNTLALILPAPDDHFTASPDCCVLGSRRGRIDGAGRGPTIGARDCISRRC